MIDTVHKFFFPGKIVNDRHEESKALVYLEYDKYDPSILNCTLTFEDMPLDSSLLEDIKANPRIVGELPNGRPVLIKFIGYSSQTVWPTKKSVVILNVDTCIFGFHGAIPFNSGNVSYVITLLSAPAVEVKSAVSLSYLGEIDRRRKSDDSISWESEIGQVRIANYYEHDKGQVGLERADVQIEMTQLIISQNFSSQVVVEESLELIEEQIEDYLLVLSLLNRKFIRWYKIEASFSDTSEVRNFVSSEKRKKLNPYRGPQLHPLFGQYELKKGLLFDLINAYKKSAIKNTIERSVTYLTGSYELDRLEPKLLIAYSAIESIVNQLSQRSGIYKCLCDGQFKRLKENLSNEVEAFFEKEMHVKRKEHVVEKEGFYPEDIKKKLAEIRTRPLKDRMLNLISKYNIDCSDIWDLAKIGLEPAIQEIITRRNKLIHNPENIDANYLYIDLVRLQTLCERLILAELGFNDYERFYPLAYNLLHSIRESLL